MTGFDIWNELGNTYFKVGAYNEAIDAYAKAIELNPKFGWAYSNLALAYTRSGRLLEAIPHYQKSIELLQDKVDKAISLNRLGDAYRQLNEYDNAAAAYEAADRLGPNSALPAENLPADAPAPAGQQEGHDPLPAPGAPNSAPAAAQSAGTPEASLKNARVWNELGNIFAKAGTYDEAIQAYQKAIRLAPNFAWPYSNLALAHTHKANFTEAIPLYKKSIELFTDNKDKAVSWDRLGDAYRRMNVYKDAIAAYEIAKKLAQEDSPAVYDLREVGIDQILLVPSHTHIRAGVDELAESIRMHGIIQPLIVCESGPGNFVLVAGKRRLEAARQVGLERVPVIVRRMDEREMLEVAINENIHHASPDPLEVAEIYQQLVQDFGMLEEEIAASVGKTRYVVANSLHLLELPEDVKQAIACKRISELQARLLFTLGSPDMQSTALQYILRNELSVQQTEDLIRRMSSIQGANRQVRGMGPDEEPELMQEAALPAQKSEDYLPEDASLVARTRFILMSNPHVQRKTQLVSS